eukprot:scaffold4265_cov105-Isochrysis_galbana.AAC.4
MGGGCKGCRLPDTTTCSGLARFQCSSNAHSHPLKHHRPCHPPTTTVAAPSSQGTHTAYNSTHTAGGHAQNKSHQHTPTPITATAYLGPRPPRVLIMITVAQTMNFLPRLHICPTHLRLLVRRLEAARASAGRDMSKGVARSASSTADLGPPRSRGRRHRHCKCARSTQCPSSVARIPGSCGPDALPRRRAREARAGALR